MALRSRPILSRLELALAPVASRPGRSRLTGRAPTRDNPPGLNLVSANTAFGEPSSRSRLASRAPARNDLIRWGSGRALFTGQHPVRSAIHFLTVLALPLLNLGGRFFQATASASSQANNLFFFDRNHSRSPGRKQKRTGREWLPACWINAPTDQAPALAQHIQKTTRSIQRPIRTAWRSSSGRSYSR
jgi:hypothetical protein